MAEEQLPVSRFAIRLSSRVPEEVMLSRLMAEDLAERKVNLSSVVKSLLLAWYQQRMATGELTTPFSNTMSLMSPIQPAEERFEDPEDELVLRMAGISFDEI